MISQILLSSIIHKRFIPFKHTLKYEVPSLFINLDNLDQLSKNYKLFSLNSFNLFSIYENDHGYRDKRSIKTFVKDSLSKFNIKYKHLNIMILCFPRILGYVFDPLSIIYCYDDKKLISIFYEVKNTTNEQHTYIFKIDKETQFFEHSCKKKFHVSPFIEMDCFYFFKVLKPENKLSVVINQNDEKGKILFASQDGLKSDLNNRNLIHSFMSHPLMSFKVIGAIHFEALKLWFKGLKFVNKKLKIKNNITFEN